MQTFAGKGPGKTAALHSNAAPSPSVRSPVEPARDASSPYQGPIPASLFDIPIDPVAPGSLQRKLAIGSPNDEAERQAETLAARVLKVPSPALQRQCSCGGECPSCQAGKKKEHLQRKSLNSPGAAALTPSFARNVPPVVTQVLRSPGAPLDHATRNFMEQRFGYNFGHVRIHTGSSAAASAASVAAHAYTVGSDVVFGAGRYAPHSDEGRHLLAHELTHVIQQGSHRAEPRLQRFQASEVNRMAPTFADMLAQVKTLITASTIDAFGPTVDMDNLVEISGGRSAGRKLDEKVGSKRPKILSQLYNRYQFSCRCGLLDMRHFFQIMYIAWFAHHIKPSFLGRSEKEANRDATDMGREHELTSESESRFGAEDTPSNALAALTGAGLDELVDPDDLYNQIKDTLTRCGPVDWTSLSKTSQNTIIHFYGDLKPDPTPKKAGDQIPVNQNPTAVPDILNIPECSGKERSLPFTLDTGDSDNKTLRGRDFLAGTPGITKGKEVKAFVNTQRPEVIKAIPLAEKIRLLRILLDPPVDDDDLEAVAIIRRNSTAQEQKAEPTE